MQSFLFFGLAMLVSTMADGGDGPSKAPCTEAQTLNVTTWLAAPVDVGCSTALPAIKSAAQLLVNYTDAELKPLCASKTCMTYVHVGLKALPNCVSGTTGNANAALDVVHDKCDELTPKTGNQTSTPQPKSSNQTSSPQPKTGNNTTGTATPTPTAKSAGALVQLSMAAVVVTAVAACV
ncbi:hypothetical protein SDRG_12550 [Saprolegnia diclina VS20]|uniref:Elicitin n=1 Tax=Saprolegnia diclina (strain VS20) TaxID=1156394 RepID=T0PW74_SAPDV|nr:hypothetical protein SDRG_12550 [Saprolegnia diclina VS20]EQC29779.1 hypothetical protein SDRG_12550 [Saprolegnia diclina VS20]|eukprot:XP_008616845.1 hypothetical protein SDRG_12550 [Saprolegnia diclina VS20]